MKNLFKVVQYRVTDSFGNSDIGEIRNAIMIVDDSPFALIYHPYEKPDMCGSFEICKLDKGNIYVTDTSQGYVNSTSHKLEDVLLGMTKDWKQFIVPPKPKVKKNSKKQGTAIK